MSSSSTKKTPCVADSCKSLGILKCEGCSQIFCRKHVNEHRDELSHQWDEIVLEHDTLKQKINKQMTKKIIIKLFLSKLINGKEFQL